jgi:type VI secretion system protein ImpG
MDDRILTYYERELTYIRESGSDFARKYPKIAGRLLLEADKCEDPHTERLIEAFAFLCGRIHEKIDDEFPEITESLLNILYPHYVNPIPSMSVVRFEPTKKTVGLAGYRIEKGAALYSRPVGGHPCRFATTAPVVIWPVEVASAALRDPKRTVRGGQQAIHLQIRTFNNIAASQLPLESLRFFLNGQAQHIHHLYELLLNNVCHVEIEAANRGGKIDVIPLAPADLRPVGFEEGEAMLPYSKRSFPGYLHLFEYFCFPEKFLFIELFGLSALAKYDLKDLFDIHVYLDRTVKPNTVVNAETFSLNAAPVVNLFDRVAEPIRVDQRKPEYRVVADLRRQDATEVFFINRVAATTPDAPGTYIDFSPFYSIGHHLDDDDRAGRKVFWLMQRRPSVKKGDEGTEVYLSFCDARSAPVEPDIETVTAFVSCTNRDVPGRLPFGNPGGDFEMETAAPVAGIHCLLKPTPTRRPALRGALRWRLVSHLSLNYLSLVEDGGTALKEILKLYDFENSAVTRQQIGGIASVSSRPVARRIGESFGRGVDVTIEFDESKYVGTGLFLFASVLERFLAQYVSINSFCQLTAKTNQRKDPLRKWPPRNGYRVLL